MSDYYKTNTLGLPRGVKNTHRFKNATHVYVSTSKSIYGRKFFCKMKLLCLTWWRRIDYLVFTYLPNFKHKHSTYRTFFVDNFFICSVNVLLGNKINLIRSI